jgi:3,4-dihydroxy 2-butanone 4-phosphate synthase/GTP cyclohydrolase II
MRTVEEAIAAYAAGAFVVVIDDEDRENEGDLVLAAEAVTPEKIAFMVRHTSGLVCTPMTRERLTALRLPPMVLNNTESHQTAFTVSVDAKVGTTTGISATDRSVTIRALIDPACSAEDFNRPGHVFPLESRTGGVLERAGHTEAAVDLARLAGLYPAGVLAEIVNPDGTMARRPELLDFAARHGLAVLSIGDLVRYRLARERIVRRVSSATIPTDCGSFMAYAYVNEYDGVEHIALVMGQVSGQEDVLVRLHAECLIGDVFRSHACGCAAELNEAMERIGHAGRGVVVYLRSPAHAEEIGAQILDDLGVASARRVTGSPDGDNVRYLAAAGA